MHMWISREKHTQQLCLFIGNQKKDEVNIQIPMSDIRILLIGNMDPSWDRNYMETWISQDYRRPKIRDLL